MPTSRVKHTLLYSGRLEVHHEGAGDFLEGIRKHMRPVEHPLDHLVTKERPEYHPSADTGKQSRVRNFGHDRLSFVEHSIHALLGEHHNNLVNAAEMIVERSMRDIRTTCDVGNSGMVDATLLKDFCSGLQ